MYYVAVFSQLNLKFPPKLKMSSKQNMSPFMNGNCSSVTQTKYRTVQIFGGGKPWQFGESLVVR